MTKRRQIILILICFIAYTFAQLGRYSYNSNVTLVMDRFNVDHAVASVPATFFFFAYGIGQIIVGLLCNKMNRKLLIVTALFLSGVINLVVYFGASLFAVTYLWLINGLVQANLWPVLLLILRENLPPEKMAIAGIFMGFASAGGKLLSIGVCAVFAIDTNSFMYCFLTAGILLLSISVLFFFLAGKIKSPERTTVKPEKTQKSVNPKTNGKAVILLLLLGEFSLASYAILGGLQSWVPSILKDSYGMTDSLSIFMSILLPLFTLLAVLISPYLYRRYKNYIFVSAILFIVGAVVILGVLLFLDVGYLPVIVLLTVESIIMGIISDTTTVQVPLNFKGKINAGFLAGYMNGTCYIGTALATYVLGALADASGWTGAFILLICIAGISALSAFIYLLFNLKTKKSDP